MFHQLQMSKNMKQQFHYKLSHTNRRASDLKTAEADELLKQIEALN